MKPTFTMGLAVFLASSLVVSAAHAWPGDGEPADPSGDVDREESPRAIGELEGDDEEERADDPAWPEGLYERTRVRSERDGDVVIVDREREVRVREPQPLGLALLLGGGVSGFGSDSMRDVTSVGGSWEVRVAAGTRSPVALELGYVGTAHGMDAIGLDEDAVLLGNGAEALARLNIFSDAPVQPYALGGAGYRNYRITNTDQNLSNLADSDNVFEVPVGGGVSVRIGDSALLDLRGTYRFAFEDDLTDPAEPDDGPEVGSNLNSWGATLRLGVEF